jgi:Ni,Fe-hydrogenase III small subunit
MKMNWFLRGLVAGVRTERLPGSDVVAPGLSPGIPATTVFASAGRAAEVARVCPTRALEAEGSTVRVATGRCIDCMRCGQMDPPQNWRHDVRWAETAEGKEPLPKSFRRSIHVRIVDAGDCGSCLNELALLNGPSYNLHRFGIFITPTPRQADVLLVVGPMTAHMQAPLRAAYDAMPEPKRVVAVGACAITGGIFGPSVMCDAGVGGVVPVDMAVPGCPPPPLVIIDALRTVCGQTEPAINAGARP